MFTKQRMRERRLALRLTPEGLASKANLVPSIIEQFEVGTCEPHPDVLPQLAEALECSVAYLTGESDVMNDIEYLLQDIRIRGIVEGMPGLSEDAQELLIGFAQYLQANQ